MTLPVTDKKPANARTLHAVTAKSYDAWCKTQPGAAQNWLKSTGFKAKAGNWRMLPGKDGLLAGVVAIIDEPGIWSIAGLSTSLPEATYELAGKFTQAQATQMALGWALGSYRFTRYKKSDAIPATLRADCDGDYVKTMAAGQPLTDAHHN